MEVDIFKGKGDNHKMFIFASQGLRFGSPFPPEGGPVEGRGTRIVTLGL